MKRRFSEKITQKRIDNFISKLYDECDELTSEEYQAIEDGANELLAKGDEEGLKFLFAMDADEIYDMISAIDSDDITADDIVDFVGSDSESDH